MSKSRSFLVTCAASCLVWAAGVLPAEATIYTGTLYFTRWTGGPNVSSVPYSYNDVTHAFGVSPEQPIAQTPGADGIIFAPNGNLLVGGQGTGFVYEVNPTTGAIVNQMHPGTSGQNQSSYHLTMDPSGTKFYTSDFGGPLDTVPFPMTALGFGTTRSISGSEGGLTQIAFGDGTVFYVNGAPNGGGNLGTIDITTGVTSRLYTGIAPAHGLLYDPFTDLITMFGAGRTGTMNATNGSNLKVSNTQFTCDFDQGAVDGKGHALIAGCNGITFLDYSLSMDITNPDYFTTVFGFINIDDVAPLVGAGANPNNNVPEPATIVLLGAGLLGAAASRRRKAK